MKLSSDAPHKKARIEIIPLIDIMFFLLASFMLVSMSMVKLQKIETKLPAKSNTPPPPPDKKQDITVLGIDASGHIYYDQDKDPVDTQTVINRLSQVYKAQGEETRVYINSDKDAKYEMLITVLDAVRSLGIKKVNFPVKKDNTFDPAKPRPNTHVTDVPVGGTAVPAVPPAAPITSAAPASPANP